MAFKMIALFATLACASAGYIEADHAPLAHYSSAQAVSYSSVTHHASPKLAVAKTVAYGEPAVHYAAALTKSYAVHQPALLKTVVAQPTYTKTVVQQPDYTYGHAGPLVHSAPHLEYSKTLSYAPLAKSIVAQPAYTSVYAAEPAYAKTLVQQPSYAYGHAAPLVKNVEYSNGLSYAPLAKTVVSQPAYTKVYAAEPAYTKAIVAQPTYAKTLVSEPIYAHAAPVVAAKTLSYAPAEHLSHVSYADNSAQYGW